MDYLKDKGRSKSEELVDTFSRCAWVLLRHQRFNLLLQFAFMPTIKMVRQLQHVHGRSITSLWSGGYSWRCIVC